MRITLAPGDAAGVLHYRMLLPYKALAAKFGWELRIAQNLQSAALRDADVVVFHKVSTPHVLAFMAEMHRAWSRPRMLMDIDDNWRTVSPANLIAKNSNVGNGKAATRVFEAAARLVDLLTVSTSELASVYADLCERIAVCENAIDDETFAQYCESQPVTGAPKRLGQIRVGYQGTYSHQDDVATIVKPLAKMLRKHECVRLVFFGQDFRGFFPREFWGRIEWHESVNATKFELEHPSLSGDVVMPKFYAKLAELDLDIGLAPITTSLFNKSKTPLKAMEYGMMGIPVIATRYGPYRAYAEDGGQIFTAYDARDWEQRLDALITEPETRAMLAHANRAYIAERRVVSRVLPQWERAFDPIPEMAAR